MTSIHQHPPSPEIHKRIERFFSERAYPVAERMVIDQGEMDLLNSQYTDHFKEEPTKSPLAIRRVRGIKNLAAYLESINCPISTATISRYMKLNKIPFHRPGERIIIFDLNEIDSWLTGKR